MACCLDKDRRIAELEHALAVANARIAELEEKLGKNSTNSSKPPSSDLPGTPRPAKKPTGRKPGGQPGHPRHERALLPPEKVDKVVELAPVCPKCNRQLPAKDPNPKRYQSIELPPIRPIVTEFRCHEGECPDCHVQARAVLPANFSVFGSRLHAIVALLTGSYRLSKRMVEDFLSTVLDTDISLGAVSNAEQQMSQALAAPDAEARELHRNSPEPTHLDETGWWEGRHNGRSRRAWLWGAAIAAQVAVFTIALSRGAKVAKGILGEGFHRVVNSDRWCGYDWIPAKLRQLCWSHLIRDFRGFVDRGGEAARIGEALLRETRRMFKWWHRVRDGTLVRQTFQARMAPVQKRILALLQEALVCADSKTQGQAKEILKLKDALFTFVSTAGVDPTNNLAERILRHAVMWRKTSFGTQSSDGSRYVERVLTTVTTLRLQNRNVLEFLADAHSAWLNATPPPSLLPKQA